MSNIVELNAKREEKADAILKDIEQYLNDTLGAALSQEVGKKSPLTSDSHDKETV